MRGYIRIRAKRFYRFFLSYILYDIGLKNSRFSICEACKLYSCLKSPPLVY